MQRGNSVRLAAFGDIMLDRAVGEHFSDRPEDFEMADIRAAIADCDIVFANLENPVSHSGTPNPVQKPRVTFCAHPDTLTILQNLKVDVVSLGNNHLLDYGGEALAETIENLDAHGIRHAGAGRNYHEANRELLLETNGIPIAFLCHTLIYSASTYPAGRSSPGLADPNVNRIGARIKKLKEKGFLVIVSLHWGLEYRFYPIPFQRRIALQMIDAGAALILGHGPHYPQGFERYRDGLIFYSLGNFIFDEPYPFAKKAFFPIITLTDKGPAEDFAIIPVSLPNHVPAILTGPPGDKLVRLIRSFGPIYDRKRTDFWKRLNDAYFSDIMWRCRTMKSFRFLALAPLRFYREVGLVNILKRVSVTNLRKLAARS